MPSITEASPEKVASLVQQTRRTSSAIRAIGQGQYLAADINEENAQGIDATLLALKAAVDAIVGDTGSALPANAVVHSGTLITAGG